MSETVASSETSGEAGFSLAEILVAMTIMLLVLAGTLSIMSDAMKAQSTVKDVLDMNNHLRASMDLLQRDMLQVGQGLPVGLRIGIPNGAGATAIRRPGPVAMSACAGVDTFPLEASLAAVTVGPNLGPPLGPAGLEECTDVITVLLADNMFVTTDGSKVPTAAISTSGTTLTIHNSVNISDNPDVRGDNLRPGELLMLTKGSSSVLMQVTAVSGQVVTFGTGAADPLGLNQFDTTLARLGTINQLRVQLTADRTTPQTTGGVQRRSASVATRVKMITYFVNTTLDPGNPRLMRAVGGGQPNAIGFGVQALRFTYDIADQLSNPASVRMDADDLDGAGACAPDPCSENQIRKINIVLGMRTQDPRAASGHYGGNQTQNTLFTQVSLRSMAFVDRYR